MADSETSREDRTLPASERRLKEARDAGRVPRSRDFGHAMLLASGLVAFGMLGSSLADASVQILRSGLTLPRSLSVHGIDLGEHLQGLGWSALVSAMPMMGAMAVAAIIAGLVPGGPVFTVTPIKPNFGKLNPLAGVGRLFSREIAIEMGKLAVLSLAIAIVGAWYLFGAVEQFAGLSGFSLASGFDTALGIVRTGAWWLVGVVILVALFDTPMQYIRYHADMRMTPQEAKDEHKQAEGNPEIKGRVRARQREIGRARMLAAVPSADVIVTNPTHYAVALRYDEARMGAPRVVAKGVDLLAGRIREIGRECGVPLLEAPPLARALYANVEVDHEVPAALYNAVAQVLAYVYQLRQAVPGRRTPNAPDDLEVPAELDPLNATASAGAAA